MQDITPTPASDEAPPRPLSGFARDAGELTPGAFATRHGNGFFLHHGSLAPLPRTARGQATVVVEHTRGPPRTDEPYTVFSVRRTGRGPFASLITVGRARLNDIVLGDTSVSKLHAVIRESEARTLLLHDARSQNGTFLDERPVPVEGRGAPVILESGALVRFGAVQLTFLSAAELCALCLALTRT